MIDRLTRTVKILLLLVLTVAILFYGKSFLIPPAFAALFAMLLLPVSVKLRSWHLGEGLSVFLSVFFFVLLLAGILSVLAWQFSEVSKNADAIERGFNQKLEEIKDYVSRNFGLSRKEQNEIIKKQQSSGGSFAGLLAVIVSSFGGFLTNLLLTLVYTFLFLYYRVHLNKFVLMLVPASKKKETQGIIDEAKGVAQQYISGLAWMILCLWIMYSIGFSIVGVKNAVLFAALCSLLEIVPFVGNLTGNVITVLAVVMQGGNSGMIFGVLITYGIVQFIQTYLLEPLVVGRGVSINPVFTIAGLVAGEAVWGIPGMVLAIPFMGISKIVFDHITGLKPYGFLIGEEKKSKKAVVEKIKGWFK